MYFIAFNCLFRYILFIAERLQVLILDPGDLNLNCIPQSLFFLILNFLILVRNFCAADNDQLQVCVIENIDISFINSINEQLI